MISGAQAAGKSTIGRALADSLPRAVFIDGDAIGARERARGKNAYRDGSTVEALVESVEHGSRRVGLWIDNTDDSSSAQL